MSIRRVQQSLVQKERGSVSDDRVSLHLSESNSAMSLPALQRLSGQLVDGSCCTHLRLVAHLFLTYTRRTHHVTQPLIVHHADIDVRFQFVSPDARIQWLAAIVVESCSSQLLPKIIHCTLLLAKLERRCILLVTTPIHTHHVLAVQSSRLARH